MLFISAAQLCPTLPVSISCAVLLPRHREDPTHISQQTHTRARKRKHLSAPQSDAPFRRRLLAAGPGARRLPTFPQGACGRPAGQEAIVGMDQHHQTRGPQWLFPATNPKIYNSPNFHAQHRKIYVFFQEKGVSLTRQFFFFSTSFLEIQVSGFTDDFSDY